MTALRALLAGSIDYAGLFPPAGLDMSTSVANYAHYLDSDTRWALGRFVLPASRLCEFEEAAGNLPPVRRDGEAWRLSALLGADPAADIRAIGEFNCRHADPAAAGAIVVDVVEAKAGTTDAVTSLLAAVPGYLQAYVEVPVDPDPAPLVSGLAGRRGRAKIRTGGVTADAVPRARDVARFIGACVASGVPFKATAGLHHPLRGDYPLTYAPDSDRGTMFGFLNVFLAAALMAEGMDAASAECLLEESSPASFRITPEQIVWREHRLDTRSIVAARGRAIVAFGSCSFTEPVDDLTALGLL